MMMTIKFYDTTNDDIKELKMPEYINASILPNIDDCIVYHDRILIVHERVFNYDESLISIYLKEL